MRRAALLFAVVSLLRCSGAAPGDPTPGPSPSASPAPVVFIGSGDVGMCGSPGPEATAKLLDRVPGGTVFTTGDNAYQNGTAAQFQACYEPSWGRHRSRTRPVPGNHDYETPGAAPYFAYFGANAGPAGRGYYSYRLGAWHIIALNSEVDARAGSAQVLWLRTELATNPAQCTLAIWHKPLFSSGPNGEHRNLVELWRALQEFNADVVLVGHDHLYERFAPQDADGRADPVRGIRQFTVGTGGAQLYFANRLRPNSEALGSVWGVLKLVLAERLYHWEFIPVDGVVFQDSGTGECH